MVCAICSLYHISRYRHSVRDYVPSGHQSILSYLWRIQLGYHEQSEAELCVILPSEGAAGGGWGGGFRRGGGWFQQPSAPPQCSLASVLTEYG